MARVKVSFKGFENYIFKSDFDDYLSYLFYNKVNEFFKGTKFDHFKFFTFSDFNLEDFKTIGDNFLSKDGVISFIISSVDEVFLRSLISAFIMGESITYLENELRICDVKFLPKPSFREGKGSFVTISPIFLSDCVVMGNLGEILSDILTNNFCQYFNLSQCPYKCEFYSRKDLYGSYVTSEKNDLFYDYYYNIDVVLKGSPELISFAYDVGLGNKNNQGFGMLELY